MEDLDIMGKLLSVDIVLEKYAFILNGSLSYSDADRWACEMMQLFDDGKLFLTQKKMKNLYGN